MNLDTYVRTYVFVTLS